MKDFGLVSRRMQWSITEMKKSVKNKFKRMIMRLIKSIRDASCLCRSDSRGGGTGSRCEFVNH